MIIVNIDVMLAKRKMKVNDLIDKLDITSSNVSKLVNGRAKSIKFETLSQLCQILDCEPGDLLEFRKQAQNIVMQGSPIL